jgi:predicted TIM-barrel fold metal-dependent hydrolase
MSAFTKTAAAETGMIVDRKPQSPAKLKLPKDVILVSADNHVEVTEDIFDAQFPEHLRAKAPRVWFDRYWRIGWKDQMQAYPEGIDVDAALERSVLTDGFNFKVRNAHLDAERIAKEIAYPQSLLAFIRHPDSELQEAIYRTYNEYIARLDRENRGRFYGVGICANWWDANKAEQSIQQIIDLGLKSFMVPYSPGKGVDGNPISYSGTEMDRFWAVAEAAGLPVSFHIGEVPGAGGRGGFGTLFLTQAAPFRKVFGNLIFGGILDRHPKLRIVFAEGGINWVAGALQDAELTYGAHREIFDWKLKHRPSHYWHTNMFATFQTDVVGLRLLDFIGADRVMWAQDYPHSEGTFGFTANAIQEILDATSPADAAKILGGTALKLYGLD